MREKKFIAYDKKNKKWVGKEWLEYLCVCDDIVVLVKYKPDNNGGYSPYFIKQLTNPEVDNLVILQYIGIDDNNDKEIYEGNIVHIWRGEYCQESWEYDHYIKVEMNGKCLMSLEKAENKEIIGNVYDNPELCDNPELLEVIK